MFKKKWQLTLTIAFACLGLLMSLQFRTHKALGDDLNSQSSETLAAIAKNLSTKYYGLIQEVWDLRTQLRILEQSADESRTVFEAMTREQQKMAIAISSTPVEGPGLVITVPANDQNYFGYQDIVDIVNELWNAGAEAIAVNGFRVCNSTAFLPADELSAIMLNGHKLYYPYVIEAIGEPAALEKGISIPSGIIDNLRAVYKIPLEIKQVDKLNLASAPFPVFRFARPVTQAAAD